MSSTIIKTKKNSSIKLRKVTANTGINQRYEKFTQITYFFDDVVLIKDVDCLNEHIKTRKSKGNT